MTFTDEDLKRVRDQTWPGFNYPDMQALLTRLEAAEDLILNHTVTPIGYDHRYDAWKRAAGK